MKEKDRKALLGENRIHFRKDNIILYIIVGEIDEKIAVAMKEITDEFLKTKKGKMNMLIDINKAGQPSSEAKKITRERLEHERFGKIAIFGLHPVARVLASFVMGTTKKKDIRFFKTKEDALAWLK